VLLDGDGEVALALLFVPSMRNTSILTCVLLVFAACVDDMEPASGDDAGPRSPGGDDAGIPASDGASSAPDGGVSVRDGGRPVVHGEDCEWVVDDTGPTTALSLRNTARTTTIGGHTVDYVDFPLPPKSSHYALWSIWGEGEAASSGRFYATVGDHGAIGGNSYLYEYDPSTMTFRAVSDVLESYGMYEDGSFGYGKVHGQVDEGPCGVIYFHTYRASTRGSFGGSYDGDLLMRYNPATEHTTVLGVTIDGWQTPSTNMWREGGILYGEANTFGSDDVRFWAYDVAAGEMIHTGDPVPRGNRNIAVDSLGRAYYGDGPLYRFEPSTREETTVAGYPGGLLRASSRPRADGSLVLITDSGDEAYLFDPAAGTFEHIASMTGYVAGVALGPTDDHFYVVPGAHGGMSLPVERYSIPGGERTLIGELLAPIQRDNPSGFGPCSTYGVHLSADGSKLYIPANATRGGAGDCLRADGDEGAMLIVVHL
jgi:hypothetical protein